LVAIGLVNLPDFYPKPVLISVNEMGLLKATDCWVFLFNTVSQVMSLMEELSALTFSVSIDKYVVIPVI
jgi:hypothetical protein